MIPKNLKRASDGLSNYHQRQSRAIKILAGRRSRSIKEIISNIRGEHSIHNFRTVFKTCGNKQDEIESLRSRSCHIGDARPSRAIIATIGTGERESASSCLIAVKFGHKNLRMISDIRKFLKALVLLADYCRKDSRTVNTTLAEAAKDLRYLIDTIETYKREIAHCRITGQLLAESLEELISASDDVSKQIKIIEAEIDSSNADLKAVNGKLKTKLDALDESRLVGEKLRTRLLKTKDFQKSIELRPFSTYTQNKENEKNTENSIPSKRFFSSTALPLKDSTQYDSQISKASQSRKQSRGICETCLSKGLRQSSGFSIFNLNEVDSKNLLCSKVSNDI